MDKKVREILVVKREVLFGDDYFQGFMPIENSFFIKIVLGNYFYKERNEELENDFTLQQIIPYVWIINPREKKVFAYRRAGKGNYRENRLMHKWSCGVGGHIDRDTEEKADNPIIHAMRRELMEEVRMEDYPLPKIIGYLNDDSDSVGKVHFGVVAVSEINSDVDKNSEEIAECGFFSISELENLFNNPDNDVEKWTRMSWPFVKDYLEKL